MLNKPERLINVVHLYAPEGLHDRKWFLVEHLLENARMDIELARNTLRDIANWPENYEERQVAEDCLYICKGMLRDILGRYALFLSYLSDTDVPERISRKEL